MSERVLLEVLRLSRRQRFAYDSPVDGDDISDFQLLDVIFALEFTHKLALLGRAERNLPVSKDDALG